MRLDSLVSLLQVPRGTDDVKGRIGPRVNPDLLQPGQVVQIIWISPCGNRLSNLGNRDTNIIVTHSMRIIELVL